MTCSIRNVEQADRGRWEALFRAYLEFYETDLPDDGIDTVWGWIADPGNAFHGVLAVDAAGHVVGLAHYQRMHNSLAGSMTCYLADLYVEPETRGAGVGRALIDHARAFAKAEGLPGVDWLTDETNYAGRRLYDTYGPRTGFVFYSIPT